MAERNTKYVLSAEDRTQRAFDSVARNMGELDKRAIGLGATFAGAFAGLTATAGLSAIVKGAADAQDEIGKLSQKVGVSTESLSALKYAGDLADVSLDSLATGLKRLSANMSDTQAGTGEAKDAFKALGISVTDSSGNLKSSERVLEEVAERFAGMEDGAGKTAIAMKLFGKSGAELIPLLNAGAKGLKESAEEAKRFGLIVSADAAKAAEEFNDNLTRLGRGLDGVKMALGNEGLPWMNKMLEQMLEGTRIAGGFGEALRLFGLSTISSGNAPEKIREIGDEIAKLEKQRAGFEKQGRTGWLPTIDKQIADMKKQVEFAKVLTKQLDMGRGWDEDAPMERPKKAAPKLADSGKADAERKKAAADAERAYEKFRDTLRALTDDQTKLNGVQSEFLKLQRLMADDKSFQGISAARRQVLLDAAKERDIRNDMARQMEQAGRMLRADSEAQSYFAKEIKEIDDLRMAVQAIVDPTSQAAKGFERLDEAVSNGWISKADADFVKLDARIRSLLKPEDNIFEAIQKAVEKGLITEEQATRANALAMDDYGTSIKEATDSGKAFGQLMSSALEDLIFKTDKSVKGMDLLKAAALDVSKALFREQVTNPLAKAGSGMFDKLLKTVFDGFGQGAGGGSMQSTRDIFGGMYPSYDVGTDYVPRTGLALVHQGEKIIPASKNNGGDSYYIDARGADSEGMARLERTVRELHGSIERRAVGAVAAEMSAGRLRR